MGAPTLEAYVKGAGGGGVLKSLPKLEGGREREGSEGERRERKRGREREKRREGRGRERGRMREAHIVC